VCVCVFTCDPASEVVAWEKVWPKWSISLGVESASSRLYLGLD